MHLSKLVDHFEALYPGIKLTVYDLGSVKTIEKTVREQDAGIFTADVITTGNSGQVMYELLGKNRIFNYVPAHYVDRIPSENRDPLLINELGATVKYKTHGADTDFPKYLQITDTVTTLTLNKDTSLQSSTDDVQLFVERVL